MKAAKPHLTTLQNNLFFNRLVPDSLSILHICLVLNQGKIEIFLLNLKIQFLSYNKFIITLTNDPEIL